MYEVKEVELDHVAFTSKIATVFALFHNLTNFSKKSNFRISEKMYLSWKFRQIEAFNKTAGFSQNLFSK